jgi:hypothetical protein
VTEGRERATAFVDGKWYNNLMRLLSADFGLSAWPEATHEGKLDIATGMDSVFRQNFEVGRDVRTWRERTIGRRHARL